MKLIINGSVIDPDKTPIVFAFANDEDITKMSDNLASFQPKHGRRYYAMFPKGGDGNAIIEEAKKLIEP